MYNVDETQESAIGLAALSIFLNQILALAIAANTVANGLCLVNLQKTKELLELVSKCQSFKV